MSSLSYLNYIVTNVDCRNVSVEQAVGSYRLLFELSFVPVSWDGGQLQGYVPSLTSLRLVVKLNDTVVGTAFPKEEDFIAPMHPQARNAPVIRRTFALNIDPHTMERIEQERSERDVSFELEVLGIGTVFALREANFQRPTSLPEPLGIEPLFFSPYLVKAGIRHQVSQSDWIRLLDQMNYARTQLYEIPWPKDNNELEEAVSYFENARKAFLSGSYAGAVGMLRESLDRTGRAVGVEKLDWSKVANGKSRGALSLTERFLLAWNATRHLTHPAHHGEHYSREEARYILGMGALSLSLAANAPGVLKKASECRDDAD